MPGIARDDEPKARLVVAAMTRKELGASAADAAGQVQTVDAWFSTYYDAAAAGTVGKKNRGRPQVTAKERRARFLRWVSPEIGGEPMATVGPDALRRVVKRLDDEIRKRAAFFRGEVDRPAETGRKPGLSPKGARNVWGELTAGFKEACRSKDDALRARTEDPTRLVDPPDRGDDREQAALFPAELVALLSCKDVPIERRRSYAMAAYSGLRSSEVRGLTAADIDLTHGAIRVRRQRRSGHDPQDDRRTKTRAGVRTVPIGPSLLPMLKMLVSERSEGSLFRLPPPEDCAELVRKDLLTAKCTREDLHLDDDLRQHFTFHGLRHTCVTHWAVAGKPLAWLLHASGHTSYETTQEYLDSAAVLTVGFGQPHPPLPPEVSAKAGGFGRKYGKNAGKTVTPTGLEPVLPT